MNPGLPGAGIGGLFYILSALLMPICELWRWRRGDAPGQWALVARQFAIAVGIVASMSGVFWGLDTAFPLKEVAAQAAGHAHAIMWSMRVSALMVTSGVLAAVLTSVHLVRLCLRLRTVRPTAR
jgi:hypothetical protein